MRITLGLPGRPHRGCHSVLVCFIDSVGIVGAALVEMDAEMAGEVVAIDRCGAMGHAVHRGGIDMAVILHQNRPALP